MEWDADLDIKPFEQANLRPATMAQLQSPQWRHNFTSAGPVDGNPDQDLEAHLRGASLPRTRNALLQVLHREKIPYHEDLEIFYSIKLVIVKMLCERFVGRPLPTFTEDPRLRAELEHKEHRIPLGDPLYPCPRGRGASQTFFRRH